MKFRHLQFVSAVLVIGLSACSSSSDNSNSSDNGDGNNAAILHDEEVNGDITDDPFNPLSLQLANSDNRFRASVIVGDLDYVNVPAGQVLSSITLEDYVSSNSTSFIGIQAGTVFTEPATAAAAAVGNLLGYAHFGRSMIGTNILPAVSTGAGAQGFVPPLAAGDYTFWMQETSDASVDFSINFGLTVAP